VAKPLDKLIDATTTTIANNRSSHATTIGATTAANKQPEKWILAIGPGAL
jgi:hypothetical protein